MTPARGAAVQTKTITTERELEQLCESLASESAIAFDTEFVSEHSFRPELCLIQVAASGRLAAIDTIAVGDTSAFWKMLTSGDHETIVHAGREEVCFCLDAVGAPPKRLFDVQLAAGLIGIEYPAGYGSLMWRVLGKTLHKRETRTDWRKRPLSAQQIDYALDDVRDLELLRDRLHERLDKLGRLAWLQAETDAWLDELRASRQRERWRRVSGSGNLSSRELAILRELWRWREEQAERRNWPVKRVLRDDLLVELAKRKSADEKQIRAVRGMERGDLQRSLPHLIEAIRRGIELPDDECPQFVRRESNSQLNMVAQFLASALNSICRSAEVAPSIVGTSQDVRDFVAYRLGESDTDELPGLARGWRAEVVGNLLNDLLSGQMSIRIRDPHSEEPLVFEPAG